MSTTTDCYRIYRSTSSGGPWTFASSTSNTTWSEEPSADTLYYCITDVDTNERESPKSVEAVFHRPRLRIESIDAPTTVGRGQTGIPVKMYLWNDGEATGYFGGASLTFSTKDGGTPSYGDYDWTLMSPAIGTPIPTDASITVEFKVDILDTSDCNEDKIDATASETRDAGSCSVGDAGANTTAKWLIRPMASLYVSSISVPSVVYRAQKSVSVDITVVNGGGTNAQGYWDSSTLKFSQGTYENIVAPSSLPVTVSAGTPVTCRYYVDVDALCATGPAVIDAWISYRDVNQLIPIANNEGADTPGNWTVVAGLITLYRDAARTVIAESFSQGNYTVFARAAYLAPEKEHRLRWYDPNGVEVASSTPAIMTDADGTFDDELTLTTSSPLGSWRVEGTQAFDYDTLCVSTFTVGTPPAPSLTLQLPSLVTVGTNFVATLTFANIGSATILDAEPATLTWYAANTGTATWLSGHAPARQDVPGESTRTFTYSLQAVTAGDFRLQVSAIGFDETASTSPLLTAATVTSNICVIQPPPDITIASLSETYDLVTRDQDDLVVRMIVANNGSAAAYIDGASLTHSLSGHTQTIASPTALPVFLPGSSTTTLVFHVDVSSTADTGTNNISGSVAGYNADVPDDRLSVTGGTAGWNVLSYQGVLSANSSYSPERYSFTAGQRVYAIFTGLATNKNHHITIYGPTGSQFGAQSSSVKSMTIEHSFDTSSGATGTYRVDLVQETPTTRMTSLYFTLEKAGQLVNTLTVSPSSVTLGATFTVSLFVQNPVSGGSSLVSTLPTSPVKTENSSGSVLLLSGPAPASATITPFSPATFTWVFSTTAHTGTGSLSLIASATGSDSNTGAATTSSAISNSMTIIQRSVRLSSDTLDFGSMACNTSKTVSPTQVENLGNAALTNVSWQAANFSGPASATIDKSGIAFSPANGFTVAVSSKQDASSTLSIPYNTPSGSYIATCGVYSDFSPTDGAQSIGEPQDGFLASVTVTDTALVVVNEDIVDLGSGAPGSNSATDTVTAFNGGNLTLTNLAFTQDAATLTNPLAFTPASFTSLATNGTVLGYISTTIHSGQADGTYVATCSLGSDQATDTFQVHVRVGTIGILASPDPLDMGIGTPGQSIANIPFTVENTGSLSLSHLRMVSSNLTRTGGGTIPGENLTVKLPSSIAAGDTENATMSLYVAAGIPAGEYSGTQTIFEDLDGDKTYVGDANEIYDTFSVKVTVAAFSAVDVVNTTLELGSIPPGTGGQAGFLCRNIGSVDLAALSWVESSLTSDAPGILSVDSYNFLAPASVAPGETFVASIVYSIPGGQANGEYYTGNCFLYNDAIDNNTPDTSEPKDQFAIHCRIGLNSLNIIETSTQVDSSFPTQTTDPVEFTITNNGTLTLNRPCATMTTDLTSGGNTIPKANITMSPAVFSVMNPSQNKTGAWYVQVPAGSPVGSYTGTLKVWNDEDADGQIDAGETAADTMTISVGVSQLPSINVIQEPLNLYYIPAGRTKPGTFEIENTGNVDLGNLAILTVPAVLSPSGAGYSIPAPSISITSASNGYATGTVEVSVPEGQADGVYTGTQKVYVDVNENGSFDNGTDPYTTFAVTITVGEKKISADSPVQFDLQNPGTTLSPVTFSLHNLKTFGISSGRWLAEGSGFPSTGLSFTPSQFTISPSGNLTCAAGLTIPQFQAPGPYVATHTAFEDDNGNGLIDMYEASASFQVLVTVATYPLLNIVPATLVASAVAGGEAVTNVEFLIYNGGNVSFNSFAWTPAALAMGGDSLPAPPLESIVPSILGPGEYGTGTISIAPIDVEQHPGPYVGTQQLYDTVYQPLFAAAADSVDLTFIVRGPDLGFASTYQKIATSTFSASAPENRYIISGWVCPGSGSAAIGFFRADRNGYNAGFDGIIVASNSVLTRIGSPVDAGIIESQVAKNASYPDVTFTWYRVYAAFDYTFDPGVASTAWIAIKNYSPGNASYAVWFDGVQLEKYTIRGQKRPAPFTTGRKIVTPGPELSTEGGKSYFEW